MMEVIGPDGRTHVFAEGTTEAQIDAAMSALYPPAPVAAAPPIQQTAQPTPPPVQWSSPTPPPAYAPSPPLRPPASGISTPQIIGGALLAAVVTLAIVTAFMLGKGKKTEIATNPPPTNTVAPTNAVALVPQVPAVSGTPGAIPVTPEAFSGFIATQQGGNLNIRSQPAQNAPVLTKLPHGAPIAVTGSVMLADGLWRQVNVAGNTGYVKGEYISQTQPSAIAPPPQPVAIPIVGIGEWGTVTTKISDTVNMRASPSMGGRVISSIPYGAEIYIVSRQGDWYLVEWGGRRGWANTRYIVR
jgi:uncharacterized protein YraI